MNLVGQWAALEVSVNVSTAEDMEALEAPEAPVVLDRWVLRPMGAHRHRLLLTVSRRLLFLFL